MKTLDEVISQHPKDNCLDGRDMGRLSAFVPEERLSEIGVELKDEYKGKHVALLWTKENILVQLKDDVSFGFEKALNKRGISSGMMYEVVGMWNWILEEGLESFTDYAQYGLPLFKATALKYGFDNPIGNDIGNEYKYSADADE